MDDRQMTYCGNCGNIVWSEDYKEFHGDKCDTLKAIDEEYRNKMMDTPKKKVKKVTK